MIAIGLSLSLMAAVLPTLFYTGLVWWCDRYEREPWLLLAAVFLWGAIPAIILSIVIELVLHIPLSALRPGTTRDLLAAGVVAPVVEEPVKALALLGVFLFARREFDDVLDGIVYGALVGLGFAMTENVFYFMSILLDDGWGAWSLAIFLRSVIFGFNHAFFTSLVGIGLGLARTVRSREVRWGAPVVALGAAIVFHAVHNAGASLASLNCLAMGVSLLADWGGFWIVVAIIILSWRQERRWIWEYLADEGISESDRRAALSARWRSRVWLRRPRGSRAAWRSAGEDYYQLLAELAFRKRRLARLGDEPGLREDIARLRAQIREVQRRKA